jgi:hypothetical protein
MITEKKWHTVSHKTKIHNFMSGGTWYEMSLPINALAYSGDSWLGAWETQKSTSSRKNPPSKIIVPPHSLSVPIPAEANCKEPFQHASKTNSTQVGMIIYNQFKGGTVRVFSPQVCRSFPWGPNQNLSLLTKAPPHGSKNGQWDVVCVTRASKIGRFHPIYGLRRPLGRVVYSSTLFLDLGTRTG